MGVVLKVVNLVRKNRLIGFSVAFVCFAAAASVVALSTRPIPKAVMVKPRYFYDVNTSALFTASEDAPPIATKSEPLANQPAGVRAYVFSCGECSDEKARFIGFLHTYTPERRQKSLPAYEYARARDEAIPRAGQRDLFTGAGSLVRRAEDSKWFEADSEEGMKVVQSYQSHCVSPGATPIDCEPEL